MLGFEEFESGEWRLVVVMAGKSCCILVCFRELNCTVSFNCISSYVTVSRWLD